MQAHAVRPPSDPALAVIWDRLEEQVIDVIDARLSARYADEDALWDEARPAFDPAEGRLAALEGLGHGPHHRAGRAVQGGTKTSRHVDRLLSAWGEGLERPRLVHRLDRDTSGVLLLGKGPLFAGNLAQLERKSRVGGRSAGRERCRRCICFAASDCPDVEPSVSRPAPAQGRPAACLVARTDLPVRAGVPPLRGGAGARSRPTGMDRRRATSRRRTA